MTTNITVDSVNRKLTVVSDKFNSPAQITLGSDVVAFPIPANVAQWVGVTPVFVSTDSKLPSTTNVYSY